MILYIGINIFFFFFLKDIIIRDKGCNIKLLNSNTIMFSHEEPRVLYVGRQ